MTAAVEGGMAVMNHMGAQDSKETAEENRKLAAEVVDTALAPLPGFLGSAAPAVARAPSLSGGGQTGFGGGTSVPGGVNANDGGNLRPLLSSAGSCTGGFANRLNCASARGVQLPPAARMPGFIPALEKASGLPIDQLMSRGDPGSIMGAVTGGALGGETGSAVQAAMAQASQNLRDSRGQPSAATYAGGGGGGGSAASDDGMGDLTKAFGNLMEGMTKKPEDADTARGHEEEFGDRKIASNGRPIEEDRSISLFDRISRRYRASQERMAAYRFTSATNRALSR